MYCEMAAIFPVLDRTCCVATKWTRHMGFCITYSALLLKTWRVSLTYRVKSAHKLKLTDHQLLHWLFPILLEVAIYLGTWTLSSPPEGKARNERPLAARRSPLATRLTAQRARICDGAWRARGQPENLDAVSDEHSKRRTFNLFFEFANRYIRTRCTCGQATKAPTVPDTFPHFVSNGERCVLFSLPLSLSLSSCATFQPSSSRTGRA